MQRDRESLSLILSYSIKCLPHNSPSPINLVSWLYPDGTRKPDSLSPSGWSFRFPCPDPFGDTTKVFFYQWDWIDRISGVYYCLRCNQQEQLSSDRSIDGHELCGWESRDRRRSETYRQVRITTEPKSTIISTQQSTSSTSLYQSSYSSGLDALQTEDERYSVKIQVASEIEQSPYIFPISDYDQPDSPIDMCQSTFPNDEYGKNLDYYAMSGIEQTELFPDHGTPIPEKPPLTIDTHMPAFPSNCSQRNESPPATGSSMSSQISYTSQVFSPADTIASPYSDFSVPG